jgi:hypothetical protein
MRKSILLALASVLAGCSPAAEEQQSETKAASPATGMPTEGEWRRASLDGAAALLFGDGGERPLAALRCDQPLESLLIERITAKPAAGVDSIKLRIDGRSHRLPIVWDGASPPVASATVKLEDPLTDSISRVSGAFELEMKGERKLVLPADRRIGTLIEECRQI